MAAPFRPEVTEEERARCKLLLAVIHHEWDPLGRRLARLWREAAQEEVPAITGQRAIASFRGNVDLSGHICANIRIS